MKMKTAPLALLAIAFIAAVMITPIHGSFIAKVYAWTDKPSYLPGDTGVLHVTVRNTGTNHSRSGTYQSHIPGWPS